MGILLLEAIVLALLHVGVSQGASGTAAKSRLDLLTLHEIERGVVSEVLAAKAVMLSAELIRVLMHHTSRHTLVFVCLLARESRVLDLVDAHGRLTIVLAGRLERALMIVLAATEVDLRFVLGASGVVESLVHVNGRAEDGPRCHDVGTSVARVNSLVVAQAEVAGAARTMMHLDGRSGAGCSKLGLVRRLLAGDLMLPRGSLVIEIHLCVCWKGMKPDFKKE